jgi:flagellar protein FliL
MSAKAQNTGEAPKKKKLPLPIIIGVVVLALALFFGKGMLGAKPAEKTKKSKKSKSSKASKEHGKEDSKGHSDEESEEEEEEEIEVGHALTLEEFLVNLSGGGDHYLRATLAVGLRKGLTEEKAKEHVPAIRDAILTTMSAKTLKELSTPKGREGLKKDLIEKINELAEEEEEPLVGKIYFTAFATQ